ncbi:MAG: type II toxin-antitoxin system prevent-host-death family antitoxin [Caldilineaceae bacterium]
MEKTMGVTEARRNFGEIVDRVRYQGDTVVLVKSANLLPPSFLTSC